MVCVSYHSFVLHSLELLARQLLLEYGTKINCEWLTVVLAGDVQYQKELE